MTMQFYGLQYKKSYLYDFEKFDDVTVATSSCLLPTLQHARDERKSIGDEYKVVEVLLDSLSDEGFSYRINEIDDDIDKEKERNVHPTNNVDKNLLSMKTALKLNKYKATIKLDMEGLHLNLKTDFKPSHDKVFLILEISPSSYECNFTKRQFYIQKDVLNDKSVLYISTDECGEQGTEIYRRSLEGLFSVDALDRIKELVSIIERIIESKNKTLTDLKGFTIQRKHILQHFKDVMIKDIEHSLKTPTGWQTLSMDNYKGWE